ncbi:MAG: hypothetical protein ACUVRH_01490 [Candidatus Bipolaricaulia bacterium]
MMKARAATYLALVLLGLLFARASQSQGFGAESNFAGRSIGFQLLQLFSAGIEPPLADLEILV